MGWLSLFSGSCDTRKCLVCIGSTPEILVASGATCKLFPSPRATGTESHERQRELAGRAQHPDTACGPPKVIIIAEVNSRTSSRLDHS